MSSDIEKGSKWIAELNDRLEDSKVGILCLTDEALNSNWLHYEAGALAKTKDALVCSLLIDPAPEDIQYPLAQFQQTTIDNEDIRALVHTINTAVFRCGERGLAEGVLDRLFERNWERLQEALITIKNTAQENDALAGEDESSAQPREEIEMMEEIIGVTLLSRSKAQWTIDEIVPTALSSIDPGAAQQNPAVMVAIATTFEKKNIARLIRNGLVKEADGRYSLTSAGEEYFQRVAERMQQLKQKMSKITHVDPKG